MFKILEKNNMAVISNETEVSYVKLNLHLLSNYLATKIKDG